MKVMTISALIVCAASGCAVHVGNELSDCDEALVRRIDRLERQLDSREQELAEIRSKQGDQRIWLIVLTLFLVLACIAVPVAIERIVRRLDRNELD